MIAVRRKGHTLYLYTLKRHDTQHGNAIIDNIMSMALTTRTVAMLALCRSCHRATSLSCREGGGVNIIYIMLCMPMVGVYPLSDPWHACSEGFVP